MAQAHLKQQIQQILLKDWDPVDVRDVPQAHDEYDEYLAPISDMLTKKKSISELSDYLAGVESGMMGLRPDYARAQRVAQKLKMLPL